MTLRVTLEIIPHGDESKNHEIGHLDINNIGHAAFGHCEYEILSFNTEQGSAGRFHKTILHRRNEGAWALAEKAINELEKYDDLND